MIQNRYSRTQNYEVRTHNLNANYLIFSDKLSATHNFGKRYLNEENKYWDFAEKCEGQSWEKEVINK